MEAWDFGQNCVVCGNPTTDRHHIFYGTANRKISEKYGYVIPLCRKHHTGPMGIHFNKPMDAHWKRMAQIHFEENHGTREEFIKTFGRSYL